MHILIIFAHPEPKSLNGVLKDLAVEHLKEEGHQVVVSDLYKMNWKSAADGFDFKDHNHSERLSYMVNSKDAFLSGTQSGDIAKEQEKLLWADVVIFQFPLWWFGMPAILKGWFDRVYAFGFAYGTGRYGDKHWGDRYGEGTLKGKMAMLSVTIGGRKAQYSERGINGNIDDLLFPIHHGMLWYPGISVLPPFIMYQVHNMSPSRLQEHFDEYKVRLSTLDSTPEIPFRYQNFGDYDEEQRLKEKFVNGKSGFALHINN